MPRLPARPAALRLDAFGVLLLLAVLALIAADAAALGPGGREIGLRFVATVQSALPVDKADWRRGEGSRPFGLGAPDDPGSLSLERPPPAAAMPPSLPLRRPQVAEIRRCRPGAGLASSRTPTGPPHPV
ncbi:MAG: hypothetical protein K2Q10_09335 [Rhodospirillales bacterium]|nr:hypothetical protein [Rhodospirillales bacterium]